MEKYKHNLKKRFILLSGVLIMYVMANLLMYAYVGTKGNAYITDFMLGFQFGAGFSVLALLVYLVVKYSLAFRNEEKLKKMYIAETDERTLMIYQKSGSTGMNLAMFGLAGAAVFAAYFDATVFFTLIGACLFVALIRGVLKLYYRNKY